MERHDENNLHFRVDGHIPPLAKNRPMVRGDVMIVSPSCQEEPITGALRESGGQTAGEALMRQKNEVNANACEVFRCRNGT